MNCHLLITVLTFAPLQANPKKLNVWHGNLNTSNWQTQEEWNVQLHRSWGLAQDVSKKVFLPAVISLEGSPLQAILRVFYPAGSASPTLARNTKASRGGCQFYAKPFQPCTEAHLTYFVRFAPNFDFKRGGKLPGFSGGTIHSGNQIPDGTNGFSTRLMWRKNGTVEVYCYLVNQKVSLEVLGWHFTPEKWHKVQQTLILNEAGNSNGKIRLVIDDQELLRRTDLQFRTVDTLLIDSLFFSTFFGGSDTSWATPQDTYADFREFSVVSR